MFIIIIGTRSAGKSSIRDYLVHFKGFREIRLIPSTAVDGADTNINYEDLSKTRRATDSSDAITKELVTLSSTSSSTSTESPTPDGDATSDLVFNDASALLDYVTRHWRDNFVTEDVVTRSVLEPFLKRPFVLLVSVDAPTLVRFHRHQRHHSAVTLEQFIEDDDRMSFGPNSDSATSAYLFASYHLCHVNVINRFGDLPELHGHLDSLDLLDNDRLRPSWDSYFMKLASLASHRSNCMRRRVGAILVRDHAIIATGYNGTPRSLPNCNAGGCKRCNEGGPTPVEGFEECLCIHAEENALLEAGRERVGKGAVLYCNTCPCLKCTIKIVQNGVTEVVYNLSYKMDASSARVFRTAGVKLRQYSPPK